MRIFGFGRVFFGHDGFEAFRRDPGGHEDEECGSNKVGDTATCLMYDDSERNRVSAVAQSLLAQEQLR